MNNEKIFKYIKLLSYVLLGLGVVVFIYFLIAAMTQSQPSSEEGMSAWSAGTVKGTNLMLIYTYILLFITILVALIFPLINIIKNPKGSMGSLIGMLIMIVVLGVTYLFSSSEPIETPVAVYDQVGWLRISDMGLYTAYIMLVVAFGAILFGELKNAFKKK